MTDAEMYEIAGRSWELHRCYEDIANSPLTSNRAAYLKRLAQKAQSLADMVERIAADEEKARVQTK